MYSVLTTQLSYPQEVSYLVVHGGHRAASQGIPPAFTQSFRRTFDRNSETEETHMEHPIPSTAEPPEEPC